MERARARRRRANRVELLSTQRCVGSVSSAVRRLSTRKATTLDLICVQSCLALLAVVDRLLTPISLP